MKVALVTGASDRIGRAIAVHLAKKGYSIALHYNTSESKAMGTKLEIELLGAQCKLFKCNLADLEASQAIIQDVLDKFQTIDLLVNSASIFEHETILNSSNDFIRDMLSVNIEAPIILMREFAKATNKGQVINITDAKADHIHLDYPIYYLSKNALTHITKIAAKEFSPRIRVNAIAPGFIIPPRNEVAKKETDTSIIPMQRQGDVEDICNALEFLLSNNYITGETINVDGGRHLG